MAACNACGGGGAGVARLWNERSAMSRSYLVSAEADGRGRENEARGVAEGVGPDPGGAESAGRSTGAGANGGREWANWSVTVRFG